MRDLSCKWHLSLMLFVICSAFLSCSQTEDKTTAVVIPEFSKNVVLDFEKKANSIDGFGVNITPAQWNQGNLKSVIDLLVDDLGSTIFRFDCYGKADWLDPAQQLPDKSFPEAYLSEVYSQKVFTDAWETFRYLNSKGIEPIFNISGRIPTEWAGPDGERLTDFESYAEMAVSLLRWARFKEDLEFSLFMPFNETNLGFPEGPLMKSEDCVPAVNEIVSRLNKQGMSDIKLIVMGDSHIELDNIQAFLDEPSLAKYIVGFSGHTYGNSPFKQAINMIEDSPYKGTPFWMTEYGDLDQTSEIEFEFAKRSTRRLIRFLNEGVRAAQAWDAFDNLHEHDATWAHYGLLKTDSSNWTYSPKKRYYAAKHVYRFVRPGFQRIDVEKVIPDPDHVYAIWMNPFRNFEVAGFVSENGSDFTIVGLNSVEGDVELTVDLRAFPDAVKTEAVHLYQTDRVNNFKDCGTLQIENGQFVSVLSESSIFTLTTLD